VRCVSGIRPGQSTGSASIRNRLTVIEAGTDPTIVNPRLVQLRAEREAVSHRLATSDSPDRLSPADIDALLTELGGLASVLGDATRSEKASIYRHRQPARWQ
jgi:hypothetical protein